jgi:hypothetical protein
MAKKSLYSLHPTYDMDASYGRKLHERTGKTIEQWIVLVKKDGPDDEKARRAWLKEKHGLTTNYAFWVAERAAGRLGADDYDPEQLVEDLFAPRPLLRPLYDRLLLIALGLGTDVKACPGKTIVPLYRHHVFAELKPSTKTRLDLGLALGDEPFSGLLLDTGGRAKGDRITHRIAITRAEDVDAEALNWLKKAYERDTERPTRRKQA